MKLFLIMDLKEVYLIIDRIANNSEINTIDTEALVSGLFAIITSKIETNKHMALLQELILDQFYSSPCNHKDTNEIMKAISSDLFQALGHCYNAMVKHGLYIDNQLHYDYYQRLSTWKAAFKQSP